MPGECYSLKRTHAQNFGSCSTSFPMWFVGDMKTMTSYSPELQKYMPGYEKTKRYFTRTNLYKYLTENGDLERAMSNSEKVVPTLPRISGGFKGVFGDT